MEHLPVLLEEVLQALAIQPDGIYVDCTFGRGGHSRAILDRLGANGRLIALDRDADAIRSEAARELACDRRFILKKTPFSSLADIAEEENIMNQVDGILMDLGVSSPQLDTPERGFSFLCDGPLDMRMDDVSGPTAAEWLAQADEKEIVRVLFDYGEERFARRIARAIVERRKIQPVATTRQLVDLINEAVPVKDKYKHPATRTFQAIRIQVNRELDELECALQGALAVLKPQGRLAVISFHSLEDRLVKRFIRAESGIKYDPGRLPIKEADLMKGVLRKLGKPIKASDREVSQNPRSRSAVLRVAEKR
ncbi:MAG: 16S rRNA (cytosine(1402)-N(4))-methyltransferase RsmH [Methylomicrobium sp.]